MIADAARHRAVLTVEDGVRDGGIGMTIADQVRELDTGTAVHVLGLPSRFFPQGSADKILASLGLDAAGITAAARTMLA